MGRSSISIRLQFQRQTEQVPLPAQWQASPTREPATASTSLAPQPSPSHDTQALSPQALLSSQHDHQGEPSVLSATTGEALPATAPLDPPVTAEQTHVADLAPPSQETDSPARPEPSALAQALRDPQHEALASLYGQLQEHSRAFLDGLPQEAALQSLTILQQHGLTPQEADRELAGYIEAVGREVRHLRAEQHLTEFTNRLAARYGGDTPPTQTFGLTASFAPEDTRVRLSYERSLGANQRGQSTQVEVGADIEL